MPGIREMRVLQDVAVPLRDGTLTRAEVWLAAGGRPGPAVLVRTPYVKETAIGGADLDVRQMTGRGYAVVVQDVRGRGASEGAFEPFVNEEDDGFDTVAWVAGQPWCDGRVVMAGMSYVGATQWLAAAAAPPSLCAIAPVVSADEFGEGWSYTAGVPEHGFLASWSVTELAPPVERWMDAPERSFDDADAMAAIAPWTAEWFAEPPHSGYWARRSPARRRDAIAAPALVVGGWYDVFLAGTLRSFARSRDPRDRLVLGPWGHDGSLSHLVGEANLGAAGNGADRLVPWQLDFYDAVLDGRTPDAPRVRAYVLGARRWVGLETWPPPGGTALRLPLRAGGFAVDPAAPVPSRGGRALLVHMPGSGLGVRDQRPLIARSDVIVAGRTRLEAATVLAGPVVAKLAVDGDGAPIDGERLWAVTLCVEAPDGALHNLCEGVARSAGGGGRVDVALGDVCVALPAGATLVTLVAGSSFPRWPRPEHGGRQALVAGSAIELTTAPPALFDAALR